MKENKQLLTVLMVTLYILGLLSHS